MKNWIALVTATVIGWLAYICFFPLTSVLIFWSNILLDRTWASGLSIFIPGIIYFLLAYLWLMRGWIGNWFRKKRNMIIVLSS